MGLLCPDYIFKNVTCIQPEFLKELGVSALVLDVDNTLTAHDSPALAAGVAGWLAGLQRAGVQLCICSNNRRKRVAPFAAGLGLPFVSFSLKPLPRGLRAARRRFGVKKGQMALVGDQIFTDTLGAKLYGCTMLLVQPVAPDFKWNIRLKRVLERPFIKRYYDKGGQLYG